MDAQISRRLALGILAASLGTPALAQFDLGKLSRMAKTASLGEKDEVEFGQTLYGPSIDAMGGAYKNSAAQQAVARVADPLLKTSARPFSWEITVVDSNEVNAWALPGGKIGVNKGLLRYVDSEDELAAVIGHEMGHAELSHAIKQMKATAMTSAALGAATAAATASSNDKNRVSMGAGFVGLDLGILGMATSGYSREFEREADRYIATVFSRTGYSVARGAQFYKTLLEIIPENSKGRTSLFAGHPLTRERLADLMTIAGPQIPPAKPPSPAYAALKATFPTRRVYLRKQG